MARGVQTLLPYFGGNRTNAKTVGDLLRGCRWVGIPFAGGMPELLHIDAPSIVVNDLHCHVINLAMVIQKDGYSFADHLNSLPFHPLALEAAQARLNAGQSHVEAIVRKGSVDIDAARDYFVTQWMGRSGNAGTDKELRGNLSVRWNANGGDSNTRFRSAVDGIHAFSSVMRRCNFSCLDVFDFLARCNDTLDVGLYCDPPWPDAGAAYVHSVDDDQFHATLKRQLSLFTAARVVLRYGDHPLIRELYGNSDHWTLHECEGRKQSRSSQAELLIVNRTQFDPPGDHHGP